MVGGSGCQVITRGLLLICMGIACRVCFFRYSSRDGSRMYPTSTVSHPLRPKNKMDPSSLSSDDLLVTVNQVLKCEEEEELVDFVRTLEELRKRGGSGFTDAAKSCGDACRDGKYGTPIVYCRLTN